VDDVNNMNESPDIVEQVLQASMKRRAFLTKAAAAGAITWAAPVILSGRAYADEVLGGTPKCRPTITIPTTCEIVSCTQGNKSFPGFMITVDTTCKCTSGKPITCIKFSSISKCGQMDLVAYNPTGTDCSPSGATSLSGLGGGGWTCLNTSNKIFFGPARNANGAINDLSMCSFTADFAVWSGCPNRFHPGTYDFDCKTVHVAVSYQPGNNATATCTFTSPSSTLCAGQTTPPCCDPSITPKQSCCP